MISKIWRDFRNDFEKVVGETCIFEMISKNPRRTKHFRNDFENRPPPVEYFFENSMNFELLNEICNPKTEFVFCIFFDFETYRKGFVCFSGISKLTSYPFPCLSNPSMDGFSTQRLLAVQRFRQFAHMFF